MLWTWSKTGVGRPRVPLSLYRYISSDCARGVKWAEAIKRSIGSKPVPNDDPKFECNALCFGDDAAQFLQNAFLFIWTIAFLCAIEGCQIQPAKILKSFPQTFEVGLHWRSGIFARNQIKPHAALRDFLAPLEANFRRSRTDFVRCGFASSFFNRTTSAKNAASDFLFLGTFTPESYRFLVSSFLRLQ
jgi:hypothetical protein